MDGTESRQAPIIFISFQHYVKSSPRVWLIISSWLLMAVVFVFLLLSSQLAENRRSFEDESSHAYDAVYEKISINETVIEGFASILRITGDSPAVRQYATEMRLAFPHIYSVGIQQYVPANKRDLFQQLQQNKGNTDFLIKDFSYEKNRVFHEVDSVAAYYPTLFGESSNPDAEMVIGLDMFAVPFLKKALLASIRTGKTVATRPFTLAEGGQGYVLFRSLESYPDFDPDKASDIESLAVSILVRTDQLLKLANNEAPRAVAKLNYQNIAGEVITEVLPALNEPPYIIKFGRLKFESELDDFGQPFQLILQTANGLLFWDISLSIILVIATGVVCWFYLKNTYRRHLSVLGRIKALSDLADQRHGLEQRVLERTDELHEKTAEIRQLAGKLINLQEDDYRHIARELHDEFGQLITAIGINTKLVSNRIADDPKVDELSGETQLLVDRLHTSVHSLIGRLRPETLDTFGLKVSIEHCLDLFKLTDLGIKSQLVVDSDIDSLPDTYAITIYRAIQELVNNAVKHANPTMIMVAVKLIDSQVIIKVADDGCGMNTSDKPKGYGLVGLDERLQILSGVMAIISSPDRGCCIEIKLPLDANQE
jgi:signal transduction histidine kinase